MLEKLCKRFKGICWQIGYIPKIYIIVPAIIFVLVLIIRLSTGGTHLIYNVLRGRGLFPGPFMYGLFYIARTALLSTVIAFALQCFKLYRDRFICVVFAILACILHLLEYKLIFGGVSLLLAMIFCPLTAFLSVVTIIKMRIKSRTVSVITLLYALFQLVFFIELISLCICI